MEFTAVLRRPKNRTNLLEAAHYEHWLDSEIRAYYSPGEGAPSEKWQYLFPLFWQIFKLPKTGGVQWISYAVQYFSSRRGDQIIYFFRAAISPEHELVLSFRATTNQYDSGVFDLFKKVAQFILKSIEICLVKPVESELQSLKKSGLRNFSEVKPICRYDDASKNYFGDYELLEDPCFYFTKIGKTIDRRLWKD
ncbi:hypothetical protein ACJJI3_06330 [Microbulbifer sp. ZKSA004]|uniref:hypothetical protein n=1 Tax=Microbulbifer sp. ZKSA004 TaxID=3243389 RepID=UPI0040397FEB